MSSMVIKFDPNGQVQLLLGRKAEAERVPAPRRQPRQPSAAGRRRAARPVLLRRRRRRARSGAGGAAGAADCPGAGAQQRRFQPADRRRMGRGRQHLCGRRLRQRPHREVRQERQVHQVLGLARIGAGPVQHGRTASPSTRRATSTSPTAATSASRSSTATAISRRSSPNVGTPAAICITPGAHQYLYSSNSNPPEDIDVERRDLQAGTGRARSSASSAERESC